MAPSKSYSSMQRHMTFSALDWLCSILNERLGTKVFLQVQDDKKAVHLRMEGANGQITIESQTTDFSSISDLPLCHWNTVAEGWSASISDSLPAPGAIELHQPLIEQTKSGYCIHFDILGLIYWMLSRQEEVAGTDRDKNDRFPASASHAFRHAYLDRPVVDEWLEILRQVVRRQWPGIQFKQQQFCMRVSHDVDCPSRYLFVQPMQLLRNMAADVLKRGDILNVVYAPWIRFASDRYLHPMDPANTFDWIMDLSDLYGLTSSFYFMCGRTSLHMDAMYDLQHPAIRNLMRRIYVRGHEIGLHPSYNTYQDPLAIVSESQRLRRVCAREGIEQPTWGGRMHCLRWDHPTTMYGWEHAGMTYDSTLGYADRAGFRCGTCFEYPAFDPVADRALNLRLRPLIAMECSIMARRYMGLGSSTEALTEFLHLKNACRVVGGCFTLLWHNSELLIRAERELYQAVLEG